MQKSMKRKILFLISGVFLLVAGLAYAANFVFPTLNANDYLSDSDIATLLDTGAIDKVFVPLTATATDHSLTYDADKVSSSSNTVNTEAAITGASVAGGGVVSLSAAKEDPSEGNIVNIGHNVDGGVFGGLTYGTGNASGNRVNVSAGTIKYGVTGGGTSVGILSLPGGVSPNQFTDSYANGNEVTLSGTAIVENSSVYGGVAKDSAGSANNNTVTIDGGAVVKKTSGGANIFVGRSQFGPAQNNNLTINSTGAEGVGGNSDNGIIAGAGGDLDVANANNSNVLRDNHVKILGGKITAAYIDGALVYNGTSEVSYNTVEIGLGSDTPTIESSVVGIFGAESQAGAAHNNSVKFAKSSTSGVTTLAGAYAGRLFNSAYGAGDATHNSVTISNGAALAGSLNVYGALAAGGSVERNTVDITDSGTSVAGSVYGGRTNAASSKSATSNRVNVDGGSVANVYGGYAAGTSSADQNYVDIWNTATVTGSITGGQAAGAGPVSGNNVILGNATVSGTVTGGDSSGGDVSQNQVTVTSGVTISSGQSVIGGKTTISGNASENRVSISGTTSIQSATIQGAGSDTGAASDNRVYINDTANLTGTTVIGASSSSGTATDNRVYISGNPTLTNTTLKGGVGATSSNNRLYLEPSSITGINLGNGEISNFQRFDFTLPLGFPHNNSVSFLKTSGTVNLDYTDRVRIFNSDSNYAAGGKLTLIDATSGTLSYTSGTNTAGGTTEYGEGVVWDLAVESSKKLVATLKAGSASVDDLDFGTVQVNYGAGPAAQKLDIEAPSGWIVDYAELNDWSDFDLDENPAGTWWVKPNAGLPAGTYTDEVWVYFTNGAIAKAKVTFIVKGSGGGSGGGGGGGSGSGAGLADVKVANTANIKSIDVTGSTNLVVLYKDGAKSRVYNLAKEHVLFDYAAGGAFTTTGPVNNILTATGDGVLVYKNGQTWSYKATETTTGKVIDLTGTVTVADGVTTITVNIASLTEGTYDIVVETAENDNPYFHIEIIKGYVVKASGGGDDGGGGDDDGGDDGGDDSGSGKKSSGSGCDAGFGAFALLAAAGAVTLLRKKD